MQTRQLTFLQTWCWVIIMATTREMTAMMFRMLSSRSQQSRGLYLGFMILVLLAPICKFGPETEK